MRGMSVKTMVLIDGDFNGTLFIHHVIDISITDSKHHLNEVGQIHHIHHY